MPCGLDWLSTLMSSGKFTIWCMFLQAVIPPLLDRMVIFRSDRYGCKWHGCSRFTDQIGVCASF